MSSARAEVMATHGFTFYTDLSNRIVDQADSIPVEQVNELAFGSNFDMHYGQLIRDAERHNRFDLLESRLGLQMVINGLVQTSIPGANGIERSHGRFGIRPEDLERFEKITAGHGFFDLAISWEFAGALASQAADVLIDDGVLQREETAAMTLEDWGTIIKSPWLKSLAHRTAMTGLGTYGAGIGYLKFYEPHALLEHIIRYDGEPDLESAEGYLRTGLWEQGEDSHGYIGVMATPRLISILGQRIKKQNEPDKEHEYTSSGCPVARHSTRLPAAMLEEDPHTVELIKQGTLRVSRPVGKAELDTVVVSQLESAIDKQLTSIGSKLIQYHQEFGSPAYSAWPLDQLRLDYARRKRDKSGVIDKLIIPPTTVEAARV